MPFCRIFGLFVVWPCVVWPFVAFLTLCRVTLCRSTLGRLTLGRWIDCPKDLEFKHHGDYISISDGQYLGQYRDFWTVPKTQSPNTIGFIFQSQRPKSLGQFRDVGTVPKTKSPNTIGLKFLNFRYPKAWDSPADFGIFP